MKVFYTNSPRGRIKYGKYYDAAVDTLRKLEVDLISLEVMPYENLLGKEKARRMSQNERHYMFIRKGIDQAHAVIIDASIDSFSLGHESTLALLYNKPFLCISNNWDYSQNIKHPKFNAKRYKDEADLKRILKEFIDTVQKRFLSVRFNGFLSPEQKNYLDWYSVKTGMNISEIIRGLIDRKQSSDEDYQQDSSRFFLKDGVDS